MKLVPTATIAITMYKYLLKSMYLVMFNGGILISLSTGPHQAIIWTSAGLLSMGLFRLNFREIWIEIYIFACD